MFRVILDVAEINYDDLLDQMIEMAKANPAMLGGFKLPPFFSGSMLKKLPQQQKNEMLIKAIESEKGKFLQSIQQMITVSLGPVILSDIGLKNSEKSVNGLSLRLDVARGDYDRVLELLTEKVIQEEDIKEILGDHFEDGLTMDNLLFYMKGQPEQTKEYLVVKTLSVKKAYLTEQLEQLATGKNVELKVNFMRFLFKES